MKAVPFISLCAVVVVGGSAWMLMQETNPKGSSAFTAQPKSKGQGARREENSGRAIEPTRPQLDNGAAIMTEEPAHGIQGGTSTTEEVRQPKGLALVLTSSADVKSLPGYSPERVDRRPLMQRYADVQVPLILKDSDASAYGWGGGGADGASQSGNSGKAQLTPDQQEAIDRMRDEFVREIGGGNQNPDDPGYRAKWQRVQPRFDERLKIMLGIDKFNQYQIDLAQREAANRI